MVRPLFISIAVHEAEGLQTLPGVLESSAQICAWADKDYDVIEINDEKSAVTINRIRKALTPDDDEGTPNPATLLDRPRIIVYFAGHGFAAWPDQYWILSRGPDQPRERISANLFRDILASYGPTQIAFISDACRSSKALTGLGDGVLDYNPGPYVNPQKDIFYSCQLGAPSYAVPATDGKRAYLVFSSVLLKGLSAPDDTNLDKVLLLLNRRAVTSQSLSTYLEENVPQAALEVERIQITQCDAGFKPLEHIYVEFAPLAPKPDDGKAGDPWKSDPAVAAPTFEAGGQVSEDNLDAMTSYIKTQYLRQEAARTEREQPGRLNSSRSEWRAPVIRQIAEELDKTICRPSVALKGTGGLDVLVAGPALGSFEHPAVFKLAGGETSFYSFDRPLLGRGETLCAIYGEHSLSLVPMFANMHSIGVINDFEVGQGLEFLSWCPLYGDIYDDRGLHAAEALKGLSRGFLRPVDAPKIADQLRYRKHLDPMLGIVAAYLYSEGGDIANIRRMAYYYCQHDQAIPFDIAILGDLPIRLGQAGYETVVPAVPLTENNAGERPPFTSEATQEVYGEIAGLTPILRVGWPHLRRSEMPFHKVCWRFIDNLATAPITTFVGTDAIEAITAAFREGIR